MFFCFKSIDTRCKYCRPTTFFGIQWWTDRQSTFVVQRFALLSICILICPMTTPADEPPLSVPKASVELSEGAPFLAEKIDWVGHELYVPRYDQVVAILPTVENDTFRIVRRVAFDFEECGEELASALSGSFYKARFSNDSPNLMTAFDTRRLFIIGKNNKIMFHLGEAGNTSFEICDVDISGSNPLVLIGMQNTEAPYTEYFLKRVNLKTGDSLQLSCGPDEIRSVRLSKDGKYCAIGRRKSGITFVDVSTMTIVRQVYTKQLIVTDLRFSSDGRFLFAADSEDLVVIETNSWREIARWSPNDDTADRNLVCGFDLSTDDEYVYVVIKSFEIGQVVRLCRLRVSSIGTAPNDIPGLAYFHTPSYTFAGVRTSNDGSWIASVAIGPRGPEVLFVRANAFEMN